MESAAENRHLHAVPNDVANEMVPDVGTLTSAPVISTGTLADGRPSVGLGAPPVAEGGATPSIVSHVTAFGGTAAMGSLIGFAAARTGTGAIVGAGVNMGLLGLVGAVLGGARLSTTTRAVYGGVGVFSVILAGWLSYKTSK